MPAEWRDPAGDIKELILGRIIDQPLEEVEPHPADPAFMQRGKLGIGDIGVDHRNPARLAARFGDTAQRRGVIEPVATRLDDHVAGKPQVIAQPCFTFIAEITAICEYLDELFPEPPLIGSTPEERAVTRMWTRRIDLHVVEPMLIGFRSSEGFDIVKDRARLLPEAADDLKTLAQERIAWLDGLISDGPFVSGARLTLGDILLFRTMDFGASVGQPLNSENKNIAAWFARMAARPSATASAW